MSAERVVVTRTEIRQLHEKATEILAIVDSILSRPEPRPVETDDRGWPELGTSWDRHDDPEEQP